MSGYILMPSFSYMTCCLPPLMVNGRFVRQCKQGALQFVLLKPILAIIILVLYTQGKYAEGDWGIRNGQVVCSRFRSSAHTFIGPSYFHRALIPSVVFAVSYICNCWPTTLLA
jgi:hypothetical protein